ncbi:YihY/virulence factor BrkB family protein [Lacibacterium aquatile]|uniref:YihY/virulence factor BrkB family protein n=1 Tax=Lacibacterium aquatile TaxID=1168082 RepID=A0ABW5DQC3_9PROT
MRSIAHVSRKLRSHPAVTVPVTAGISLASGSGLYLASHVAFSALLALFPFLLCLTALVAFMGGGLVKMEGITHLAFEYLPPTVAETLLPVVEGILRKKRTGFIGFGLIGALWAASSGVDALRDALTGAYRLEDRRAFWKSKLVSLVGVLLAGVAFILLSLAVVLAPVLWKATAYFIPLSWADKWVFDIARYTASAGVLFGAILVLHRWLPCQTMSWRFLWPGVLTTSVLWLALAAGFSLYVTKLGNLGATYGSLAGVIGVMLFFYFSAILFVLGAEVNIAIRDATRRDRGPATMPGSPARSESGSPGAVAPPPQSGAAGD